MAGVDRKTELEAINGTPEKRLFLSIISDYDLQTGLCELVDNALDFWVNNNKKPAALKVDITLDAVRQLIKVRDNAGGVRQDQLRLLVAPGASGNSEGRDVIGIFGVGGKRAGVALGERVEIRTRAKGDKSLQLDITNDWLAHEDWELTSYEIPDIAVGTTTVDISQLRQPFTERDVEDIRSRLGEIYEWFIGEGCEIRLNGKLIVASNFDGWAYPPDFLPRTATFDITPADEKTLSVTITAGLIHDRDPIAENYGVYIFCNNRLIVKELRTREVGYFVSSEAGVPHPDASLCRVIVEYSGPPEAMPWNSSKSGISFNHPAFIQIRARLIGMVSYYSSLSRRLKRDWEGRVFPFTEGDMEEIEPEEILSDRKIVLPALPRVRKRPRIEEITALNKKTLSDKPWTVGLIDALGLVELIRKQKCETKNRAALILLDSNFEIALKEFIVNRRDLFPPHVYNDAKILTIFKARHSVINEVTAHITLSQTLLGKVSHYYNLRNKLVHERATVGITDAQVADYTKTVEQVLKKLFGLKFPA
jgi:hypothetical protein